jgi:hypothetical protein
LATYAKKGGGLKGKGFKGAKGGANP